MNRLLFLLMLLFADAALVAQTWTLVSPKPTNLERRSIQMVTDSVGYSGGYGMPLKTTDGGASWFYPNSRSDIGGVTMTYFATPDSGWATIGIRAMWRTTNGGASWDSLYGVDLFEGFSNLHFFNSKVGCAVGSRSSSTASGRAWWTNNGGNAWTVATTAQPLRDVQLLSATIAVACADSGKIYRTTNAGLTWSEISTPTTNPLRGIHFREPSVGIAVGVFGTDLRTNDSGQTWGLSSVFTTQSLNDVTDFGQRVFVGNNNTVYAQPNGSVTPFPNRFINYYAITSRIVNNVETLYLAGQGGLILTSQDNGATWRIRNGSPFRLSSIDFPTPSIGYIGGQGGVLLKTTNGGNAWDTLRSHYANDVLDLKFPSPAVGYALIQSSTARDSLLKTTDGGASWTASVLPLPTNHKGSRLFFLSDSLGFIIGTQSLAPRVAKTTDGGASWTSASTGSGASRDVCFITPAIGFAVGEGGSIRKSTDGGNTWQSQSSGTTATLNRVVFLDSLTGFVCGGTSLRKTTNGGASWTSLSIIGLGTNLVDIFFLDSQNGVLLDASSFYYRTTNGGNSWQQFRHSGGINNTARFFFLNAQKGFIVGDYGMIQQTNNAQLPVEWHDFTASAHREGVLLKWTTQSERNNSGFSVERQQASPDWQSIGFVRGNGTSAALRSYSFIDKFASGATRYRLKQFDFDGKFEYSPIAEFDAGLPRSFALEQNYPNPFNPTTTIRYQLAAPADVQLVLYDVLGRAVARLVNARQAAGAYSLSVNASEWNLSSGVYFYRLQAGQGVALIKKMILVK